MRLESFLTSIVVGVTRQTPNFSRGYRPAPPTLIGQIWAGLTRNTPAFGGARMSEAPASARVIGGSPGVRAVLYAMKAVWKEVRASLSLSVPIALIITLVVLFFFSHSPSTSGQNAAQLADKPYFLVSAIAIALVLFWRFTLRLATLLGLIVIGFSLALLLHIIHLWVARPCVRQQARHRSTRVGSNWCARWAVTRRPRTLRHELRGRGAFDLRLRNPQPGPRRAPERGHDPAASMD